MLQVSGELCNLLPGGTASSTEYHHTLVAMGLLSVVNTTQVRWTNKACISTLLEEDNVVEGGMYLKDGIAGFGMSEQFNSDLS